jgi:putative oxidoreductase
MKTSTYSLPNSGATLLRVALGLVMLAHAAAKYFQFTLPGTAAFFAHHGFPGWTAYPVFFLEAIGGVLLVLGWHTRWVSIALLPVMMGAWMVHAPNGWMFTAPNGGWEYPGFLTLALGAQALLGNGITVSEMSGSRRSAPQASTEHPCAEQTVCAEFPSGPTARR